MSGKMATEKLKNNNISCNGINECIRPKVFSYDMTMCIFNGRNQAFECQ